MTRHRIRHLAAALAAAALMAVGLAGCGSDSGDGGSGSSSEPVTLTVFAAASLTDTFKEVGKAFEGENEGVDVAFSFAGSSDLVTQIQAGAPADVFASADEANMKKATDAELMSGQTPIFVTNTLTIAVPEGNPKGIDSLDDLAGDGLDVVVCAPEVPCGRASVAVEEDAGIDIKPVSEEQNVTDVLNKVATGEADAGLVYVTDIARAEGVEGVDFPESSAAVNRYPIGVVKSSEHAELAQKFIDFVLGQKGQAILGDAGFRKP